MILRPLAIAGWILACWPTLLAMPAPPPPVVRYEIRAEVDPAARRLKGREVVHWTNTTATAASELRFHLYLNAFRDARSTWMVERGGPSEGRRPAWGGIEVLAIEDIQGAAWPEPWEYIAPDDGNPDDRTVMRVPLREAVEPGQSVSLVLEFEVNFPGIWARTGQEGAYIAGAQWFPSLGVFEGRPATWNCHQFHAFTEFYADFSEYQVTLSLPQVYRGRVAATGTRVGEGEDEQGRYVVRYHGRGVHDFAWFADPDFVVRRRRFVAAEHRDPTAEARWRKILGEEIGPEGLVLEDVEVEVYLQPSHLHLEDRYFEAVFGGLEWFGRAFGAYPFPELRIVDPPREGRRSRGMEYPQVFTGGAHLLSPRGRQSPEGVVVHEFGHQYFQGLLASNEFEHAFLDEGFDVFAEASARMAKLGPDLLVSAFGPLPYPRRPVVRTEAAGGPLGAVAGIGSGRWLGVGPGRVFSWFLVRPDLGWERAEQSFPWPQRAQWLDVYGYDRVNRPGYTYPDFQAYRMHTYRLTALTLESYRRAAGDAALMRALRRYFRRGAWGHPRPGDFIQAVVEVHRELGARFDRMRGPLFGRLDPGAYFHQVWDVPGWVDFSVQSVRCPGMGDGREGDEAADFPRSCRVTVRRRGPWQLPVTVELKYEGGLVERVVWSGEETWFQVEGFADRRVERVVVDPERNWVFDVDLTNNGWRRRPRTESRWRLMLAVFQQALQQLVGVGSLGG
ncbi:MAG: M1 family metallopeptidase [Acidobacteriota bacterium]|nr:M1 family metallopeptidase [Acidobacteriota bacterium]MDQ7088732.1 M1 family metallopeptidase [Acidobacteriota bacterium]